MTNEVLITKHKMQKPDDTTVLVYHAGDKTGYSLFCPNCYRDRGKRTLTDDAGNFKIGDLRRDLWFDLLVMLDGFVPTS